VDLFVVFVKIRRLTCTSCDEEFIGFYNRSELSYITPIFIINETSGNRDSLRLLYHGDIEHHDL